MYENSMPLQTLLEFYNYVPEYFILNIPILYITQA